MEEEWAFIDAILETKVMKKTMHFLSSKGKIKDEVSFRKFLHTMWFSLYPRDHRRKVDSSCAFEHVFLGEVKRGRIIGFHNWLFLLREEKLGKKLRLLCKYLLTSELFISISGPSQDLKILGGLVVCTAQRCVLPVDLLLPLW